MKTKKKAGQERNWALVIIFSVFIVLNNGILVFVSLNTATFGWWALLVVFGSISSIWFSVIAIKKIAGLAATRPDIAELITENFGRTLSFN